ncbi:hypothetical protein FDA94_10765 [Herbidospora galbida]|uniref:Uncharacterized protein n=1 Tax=Herbidospora galbida TaxID=2575442 RepID=A0A4U3MI15_9ACTN|nr:hypothetical protein [Herbidospora galbida]TKK88995.1 hypothetical protein FDA94_10765 [Herbidospora galbida]
MALFGNRLPADIRTRLSGERVLSFAPAPSGGYAVATFVALHLPGGERVPWHTVDKASWDETGMNITTVTGGVYRVDIEEPGFLPETIRERVQNSIVANRYVKLTAEAGVRFIARRIAGTDTIEWELAFDDGLDGSDPGVLAAAEQALEQVRRSLGV